MSYWSINRKGLKMSLFFSTWHENYNFVIQGRGLKNRKVFPVLLYEEKIVYRIGQKIHNNWYFFKWNIPYFKQKFNYSRHNK